MNKRQPCFDVFLNEGSQLTWCPPCQFPDMIGGAIFSSGGNLLIHLRKCVRIDRIHTLPDLPLGVSVNIKRHVLDRAIERLTQGDRNLRITQGFGAGENVIAVPALGRCQGCDGNPCNVVRVDEADTTISGGRLNGFLLEDRTAVLIMQVLHEPARAQHSPQRCIFRQPGMDLTHHRSTRLQ
jgi:hypothetical protein